MRSDGNMEGSANSQAKSMMGIINSIKNIMSEMQQTTSMNDDRYEMMQAAADLCDELTIRCMDDGK